MKTIISTTIAIALLIVGCSKDPATNETVKTTGIIDGKSVIMESTKLTNTISVTIIKPNTTTARSRIGNEGGSVLIKPSAFVGRNFTYCEVNLNNNILQCDIINDGILIKNENVDDLLNYDINTVKIGKGMDQVDFNLDPVDARAVRTKLIRYEFENKGIDIDSFIANNWISDQGDTFAFGDNNITSTNCYFSFTNERRRKNIMRYFDPTTQVYSDTVSYNLDPLISFSYRFDEGGLAYIWPGDYNQTTIEIQSCTAADLVLTINSNVYGDRTTTAPQDATPETPVSNSWPVVISPLNYTIHYKKVVK